MKPNEQNIVLYKNIKPPYKQISEHFGSFFLNAERIGLKEIFQHSAHREFVEVFLAIGVHYSSPAQLLELLRRRTPVRLLQALLGRSHVKSQQFEQARENVLAAVQGKPAAFKEDPDTGGSIRGTIAQGEEDIRLHAIPD